MGQNKEATGTGRRADWAQKAEGSVAVAPAEF